MVTGMMNETIKQAGEREGNHDREDSFLTFMVRKLCIFLSLNRTKSFYHK